MHRPISATACLLAAALTTASCASNTPTAPTPDTPVQITEAFSGTLTRNGAITHTFVVQRAGNATAALGELSPDSTAVLSLALGTWNGQSCQIVIARDDATSSTSVIGTASSVGNFCVRVSDANGGLAQPTNYTLTVTHF